MKECGILLPISMLPNKYGIGSFGKCSYDLIDFLFESKQKYLQILPLGQTGYGDSPYQTFSFYAGSVYYIDLDLLVEDGLLLQSELLIHDTYKVDYNYLYNTRFNILKLAYSRFNVNDSYNAFITNNKWVEEYSLFMCLKEVYKCSWYNLPNNYKYREKNCLDEFLDTNLELINFYKFTQYVFYKQWFNLKEYASSKNIKIIGDMPIYSSYDSVDVWCNPEYFSLDESLKPIYVSGCPADEFCIHGQYWGNPLYNWDFMKENNFELFSNRFNHNLLLYDKVRIDHFRGFSSYYKIKYKDSALNGIWCEAYGVELFDYLRLDINRIIIEDLGFITRDVEELIKHTKFCSMRVAVFGLDKNSIHLPCNYEYNNVCYSTTHDNIPINGWYKKLNGDEKSFINNYYSNNVNRSIIKHLYKSKAKLVIIAIQDILNLDEQSTLNIPNTLNNWNYRLDNNMFNNDIKQKLINLVTKYNR